MMKQWEKERGTLRWKNCALHFTFLLELFNPRGLHKGFLSFSQRDLSFFLGVTPTKHREQIQVGEVKLPITPPHHHPHLITHSALGQDYYMHSSCGVLV